LEDRLEKISGEDDYAFSIMNELANLLRKHDNLELAS
jgi:tetratricopeptide (TPR) repeat protein